MLSRSLLLRTGALSALTSSSLNLTQDSLTTAFTLPVYAETTRRVAGHRRSAQDTKFNTPPVSAYTTMHAQCFQSMFNKQKFISAAPPALYNQAPCCRLSSPWFTNKKTSVYSTFTAPCITVTSPTVISLNHAGVSCANVQPSCCIRVDQSHSHEPSNQLCTSNNLQLN